MNLLIYAATSLALVAVFAVERTGAAFRIAQDRKKHEQELARVAEAKRLEGYRAAILFKSQPKHRGGSVIAYSPQQ